MKGCNGNDVVNGNEGNDGIAGAVDNDVVHGNEGNDVLKEDEGMTNYLVTVVQIR